jgi:NADH-quinone oxidoreductase subunit A
MGFEFGTILVFAVVSVGFALGGIAASRAVGPKWPNSEKSSIYECGERPVGVAWFNFNPRFYLVALVFLVFEVDIALTFPVVAVYRRWVEASAGLAWVAFFELLIFTAILMVGLVWVWANGDLEWVKSLGGPDREEQQPAPSGGGVPRRAA